MSRRRPLWSHQAPVALSLTLWVASCGGGGDVAPPATPAAIDVASGNRQTGTAGAPLPQPLSARVTSAAGAVIEGATVTFAASANSGTVATANAVTDADGIASTTWTVGTGAGANVDTVRASVSGVGAPVIFTATVTAAAAAGLTEVSGNSQSGIAGQALAQPLVVLARDQFGNPSTQVGVAWTVSSGGGTVSPSTETTGADGMTSAIWTPGNAAVNTVQAAVPGLGGPPVSFGASITTTPSRLSLVGGNSQTGSPGELLGQPLVVSLKTQAGATVVGVAVSWVVTGGGGTVSQASVPTDGQGQSSVVWTVGGEGPQSATASVSSATGSPVSFSATAVRSSGVVTLTALTPTPMVIGQPAILTGTGFSSTAANNDVTIDGVTASVSSATATSLTVSVPHFNCQPARSVAVRVTVGGEASNVLAQDVNPSSFTTVGVGQQLVLQNGESCLQFAASTTPEDYLIGVQSTSEVVTSLTPALLTAVAAGSQTAPPLPLIASRSGSTVRLNPTDRAAERWAKHYSAEARLRRVELRQFGPHLAQSMRLPHAGRAQALLSIPENVSVGDIVPVRFPDIVGGNLCNFIAINAVVRVVGAKGIWLEDLDNPQGGYTSAEFQALSDKLDNPIYDADVGYFGAPSDFDHNNHIVVVITKEVNKKEGVGGFVTLADFIPRTQCAASNEGEIFYGIAPLASNKAETLTDFPRLIAHEFSHIIQYSRRILLAAPFMAGWTAEGQATLAEEIAGHAVEGRSPGQNYGFDVAFNQDDPTSQDWYQNRFAYLAFYFGFAGATKVANAPEQCSWLGGPPENSGPCGLEDFQYYGVSWSLLRWLSDQYGSSFPGGERGLQRALVDNQAMGYDNIANIIPVPFKTVLAQWAATLYTDDRVTGLNARLTLPSWNLLDIYGHVAETGRLQPRSRAFSSFTEEFSVRAGSSAYFRLSGASRPATSIRVRNSSDGTLPSIMQLFVVRLR